MRPFELRPHYQKVEHEPSVQPTESPPIESLVCLIDSRREGGDDDREAQGRLQRARGEIEVQLNLASKDLRDEWEELEGRWEHFQSRAKLEESSESIGDALEMLGDELRKGYARLKSALAK